MSQNHERVKIAPRNLTARAAYRAAGNPANTRLESGVGNCFPGLEMDVRDLDRRFFPGLVFNAVRVPLNPAPEAPKRTEGFHLAFVDYMYDPLLPPDSEVPWVQKLLAGYTGSVATKLAKGRWFLSWIKQGPHKISTYDRKGEPIDGMTVWRFVRSLETRDDLLVTIALEKREHDGSVEDELIVLEGIRRQYRTDDGVFDAAYQPGELTQSLCNPWSHDFRDCGCHYWPSNHPDVVMAEADEDDALPTGQSRDPMASETYLDWLRNDRGPAGAVAARNTVEQNRPYQIDHYQVNQMWGELPIVVEGRETGTFYEAAHDQAFLAPYPSEKDMIDDIGGSLAPLEMVLTMQYLYAYFSLADPDTVDSIRWPSLRDDLIFARRAILGVAIGEMTHLRWANQMLWTLKGAESYEPVLSPAKAIRTGPAPGQNYPRSLSPLTPDTLDRFIEIEKPEGFIDRAYARCVATMLDRGKYPRNLYELAVRIDSDGDEHFLRFSHMKHILSKYPFEDRKAPYLREIHLAKHGEAEKAMGHFRNIIDGLGYAYSAEAHGKMQEAQKHISNVRSAMEIFRVEGEKLAREKIGIPFWPAEGSAT